MIYEPSRHLPLIELPFSADKLRSTIRAVLAETRTGCQTSGRLWPIHTKDNFDGAPEFVTNFYYGAAGVLWAAQELSEFGELDRKDLPSIDEILNEHLRREDPYPDSPFVGQLGIRFVKQLLAPSDENSNTLMGMMQKAALNSCREILFGGPGALAMAHILWKRGQKPFRSVCGEVARIVLDQRELDQASGARIWSQNLGGQKKFIGAAHGSIGNFGVLFRVLRDLGDTAPVEELIEDAEKFLSHYAKVEGDLCNWSRGANNDEYSALTVVHWCHGAPGVLTDLSCEIPVGRSARLDELFLKGAQLVWKAGPLEKGVSLCHGTAGSGLALLRTFERTKDEMWFDRAKALAMHVTEQYATELKKFGHARFSLWTGDLGMAIFLRDILRGHGGLPGITVE